MTGLKAPGDITDAPLSARELQRSASHGSLWTMVHTVLAVPIAFVANAFVARSLGPEDYGRLAIITLAMSAAVTITNLGVSEGVQQWGAAAHARGDAPSVDRILRASLGFHLLFQMPLLVVTALVLGRGQPWVVILALLVAAVLPPALGTSSLCISIENLTAQASKLTMVTNAVSQLAISVVAVLTHSAIAVWSTRSVIGALATPMNFLLLTPHRRRVALRPRLPRNMPSGFWRFCLLTAAGSCIGLLVNSRSEIVVLQHFGSAAAVGVYALAFGVAAQMRGPVEALLAPLMPSIAGILEVHPHLARNTMLRCLRVASLLGSLLLLLVPVITALMPAVYGDDFADATALLPVLAVVALSQSVVNPLMAFARAQKLSGVLLTANLLALTVDLAIAVALVPVLGIWGAVVATSCAQLFTISMLARFQIRRGLLTWRGFFGSVIPMLAAAVVVGALSIGAGNSLPVQAGSWAAGLVAWTVFLRRTLSEATRADLARIAPSLPGFTATPVTAVLRFLGITPAVGDDAPPVPRQ